MGGGAIRMKCDVMIRFATSCGHRKDIPFQGGGGESSEAFLKSRECRGGVGGRNIFQGLNVITL